MDGRLSIDEIRSVVEAVLEVFIQEYASEPIPPFETHDPGKLSGALAAPFQSAFGEDIYPTVYDKAAALFYFIAKDHPFENGNKRTAVMVLLYFLAKNRLAIAVDGQALYTVAKAIVESQRSKDEIIPVFAAELRKNCMTLDEWLDARS